MGWRHRNLDVFTVGAERRDAKRFKRFIRNAQSVGLERKECTCLHTGALAHLGVEALGVV